MVSQMSRVVLARDDGALAGRGVVRAAVLVHAPRARPLRAHAVRARRVARAVVVGEVARHEVLVGLGRAHGQRHEHVVAALGDGGPRGDARRRARQPQRRHGGVDGVGVAEHALVLGERRQLGQRADGQLHRGHLADGDAVRQHLLKVDALLARADRQPARRAVRRLLALVAHRAPFLQGAPAAVGVLCLQAG